MAIKRSTWPTGKLVTLEHTSKVLAGNPLGDPTTRKLPVWLPPGYDQGGTHGRGRRYPVLLDMVGFTGSGHSHVNWKPFEENVPERLARLIHEKKMGPAIVVFPDCFTALGGNQYINSSAMGDYADYLTQEILSTVDREFRTLASREHRACFGKSSGGYGAIIHGMKYTKYWGAVADHSGDAYFDWVYMADCPRTLNELSKYSQQKRIAGRIDVRALERKVASGIDDGRIARFLKHIWSKEKASDSEGHALMILAMAASYDPDPKAPNGFRMPFNLETGELLKDRWKNWQKHDPINLVGRYAANLRKLAGIYIDCGWRDQYHIHYGTRILSKRLADHGIRHRYEEFDDSHSGIDYRMEQSLPFLYQAVK